MRERAVISVDKKDKEFFLSLCKKYSLTQYVLFKKIMDKIRKKG